MKLINYTIESAITSDELDRKVNEKIQEGFELFESPFYYKTHQDTEPVGHFNQALIRLTSTERTGSQIRRYVTVLIVNGIGAGEMMKLADDGFMPYCQPYAVELSQGHQVNLYQVMVNNK